MLCSVCCEYLILLHAVLCVYYIVSGYVSYVVLCVNIFFDAWCMLYAHTHTYIYVYILMNIYIYIYGYVHICFFVYLLIYLYG